MKDYYKILGIEEEATEEEIRQGWIEMTKRCHSDMKEGDERTEEIDEAYQVLKDESKKFAYDLERLLKRSILKKTHETKGRSLSIKKIPISASLLIFSLFVGTTIFGWFQVAFQPKSDILPISSLRVKESTKMVPFLPLTKDDSKPKKGPFGRLTTESGRLPEGETEAPKEAPRIMPQEPPRIFPKGIQRPDEPKAILMEPRPTLNPEPSPKVPKPVPPPPFPLPLAKGDSRPKEGPFGQITAESREIPKGEMETPKKIPKMIPQETPKIVFKKIEMPDEPNPILIEPRPAPKPEPIGKGEKAVASLPLPPFAREEEVGQFFANYIDRYTRKDIDGFLSFFSPGAVQNQKYGLEGIKKIYTKFMVHPGFQWVSG